MTCAWKELMPILPLWLRDSVDKQYAHTARELRLRIGKPVQVKTGKGSTYLGKAVTMDDIKFVINVACRYSPWTAMGTKDGYITAPGGHRIGLCGEAAVSNGIMQEIRTVNALNIRVARDFPGIADGLEKLRGSILIIGRPGAGKTTLLRDLCRQLSETLTVSIVDERGELFPSSNGKPCFDQGKSLDILSGCSKQQGIVTVLRTMGPEVIAVDEITQEDDCRALQQAGWCGVRLLATAHAGDRYDLFSRGVYKPLAASGLFDHLVILQPDQSYRVERMV